VVLTRRAHAAGFIALCGLDGSGERLNIRFHGNSDF
jgi:hypothetical protein